LNITARGADIWWPKPRTGNWPRTSAKLIVVSPANVRTAQQLTTAKVTAINNAAVAAGAILIDPMNDPTGPWFAGTGQVGGTTGDGNADIYRSTDGLHPSSSSTYSGGHDYIGRRIAAAIAATL
jgi:hypothetical protein